MPCLKIDTHSHPILKYLLTFQGLSAIITGSLFRLFSHNFMFEIHNNMCCVKGKNH